MSQNDPEQNPDPKDIITLVDGSLTLKDQLRDYQMRGEELTSMNFLDFFLDTYEGEQIPSAEGSADDDLPRGRGRPRSTRFPYLPAAKKGNRCRIIRTDGHETMPQFAGKWFPRSDDPKVRELYCASMLLLLHPWRELADLKSGNETFDASFLQRFATAPTRLLNIMENIQYYHLCSDGAMARRMAATSSDSQGQHETSRESPPPFAHGPQPEPLLDFEFEDEHDDVDLFIGSSDFITEEDIEREREKQRRACDQAFAESAMNMAYDAGIFEEDLNEEGEHTYYASDSDEDIFMERPPPFPPIHRRADIEELAKFQTWDTILKKTTRLQQENLGVVDLSLAEVPISETVAPISLSSPEPIPVDHPDHVGPPPSVLPAAEPPQQRPKRDMLNVEQRRAHDLVEARLLGRLDGE